MTMALKICMMLINLSEMFWWEKSQVYLKEGMKVSVHELGHVLSLLGIVTNHPNLSS